MKFEQYFIITACIYISPKAVKKHCKLSILIINHEYQNKTNNDKDNDNWNQTIECFA